MAQSNTERVLKNLLKTINHGYATGQIDKQRQIITVTSAALAQSYMEGYRKARKRNPTLPSGKDWRWKEQADKDINTIHAEIVKVGTKSTCVEYTRNTSLTFSQPKTIQTVVKFIKDLGVAFVNSQLDDDSKLTTAKDEFYNAGGDYTRKDGTAGKIRDFSGKNETSDVKRGTERHHKGETTVGSARLALSLHWLSKAAIFKDFLVSDEAKAMNEKFGNVTSIYTTKGTKKGGITLHLNENIEVAIELDASSLNFPGSEPYDWKIIKPALEAAMLAWAETQDWPNMKGSKSLNEDFTDSVQDTMTKILLKVPGSKGTKTKAVSRKKKNVKQSTGKNKKKYRGSRKKAGPLGPDGTKVKGSNFAQFLQMMVLMNKELPSTVRKNMGVPALVNRTGRFASSVSLTDVVPTTLGFPSFGYTYQKAPYQVFEMGAGSPPWATPGRDPRRIIDASIRELAVRFAIGRFYTRRE